MTASVSSHAASLSSQGALISRSRQPAAASTASAPVTARCTAGVTEGSVSWADSTPTVKALLPPPRRSARPRRVAVARRGQRAGIRQDGQQFGGTGHRGGQRAHVVAGR